MPGRLGVACHPMRWLDRLAPVGVPSGLGIACHERLRHRIFSAHVKDVARELSGERRGNAEARFDSGAMTYVAFLQPSRTGEARLQYY